MLVHPALPSPSGIARLLWSWIKPKFYDYLEWNASSLEDLTDNMRLSCGCQCDCLAEARGMQHPRNLCMLTIHLMV